MRAGVNPYRLYYMEYKTFATQSWSQRLVEGKVLFRFIGLTQ